MTASAERSIADVLGAVGTAAISDALDLRPPLVAEVPDGAHGADLDTGVLQHSGSNGAAAAKRG